MSSRGLFDLSGIESMGDDDIISMNINEEAEFSNKTPDVNHPEVPFETNGASGKNTSTPSMANHKQYDDASVTIPGGDKESPSAKPYDSSSISVPSKVTLTSDQYNNAISALKKSFKEGAEILEMLENVNVVEFSLIDQQNEFIENAILTAMEDGPIFESVKRKDKVDVKEIVRTLRPDIHNDLKEDKVKFYKPNVIGSFFSLSASRLILQVWTNRLWQVLGVVIIEKGNIDDLCKRLTEKYKDTLGEYKIIPYLTPPSIVDLFRTKFNWKNQLSPYMLIVDKKLPSEVVNATNADIKEHKNDEQEESKKE